MLDTARKLIFELSHLQIKEEVERDFFQKVINLLKGSIIFSSQ